MNQSKEFAGWACKIWCDLQVKRIVKQKLSQLEPTPGDLVHKKEFQLNKVRLGFSHTALHMLQHHTIAVLPGWRVGRDFVGRHGGVPYIAEVPLLAAGCTAGILRECQDFHHVHHSGGE